MNGGDGTINEVVNGLAKSETALAVLPGGTANVWAKEARVPKDPAKAMRVVLDGEPRRVDLGVANGRYFLLMAGVGLDAAIIPRVNPWLKRRAGALAYILAGVPTMIRTKPWQTTLHVAQPAAVRRAIVDGSQPPPAGHSPTENTALVVEPPEEMLPPIEMRMYWMLAGNTRNYGGLVNITHHALIDDGLLDVAIMRRGGLHLIPDGIRVLLGRHERSPNVVYTRTSTLAIETPDIPVQLDGDYCMDTPLILTTAPQALTVLLPKGERGKVFG